MILRRMRRLVRGLCLSAATVLAVCLVVVVPGGAHIERPSYWPLPGPDCTVHPCAGGAVPTARSLASALKHTVGSRTRVVCQRDSLTRLTGSIRRALKRGYYIRPTDHRTFSRRDARRLLAINRQLFMRCGFHQIQPAVNSSHNNDRVVVLPGV